jgi:hypothetical protein
MDNQKQEPAKENNTDAKVVWYRTWWGILIIIGLIWYTFSIIKVEMNKSVKEVMESKPATENISNNLNEQAVDKVQTISEQEPIEKTEQQKIKEDEEKKANAIRQEELDYAEKIIKINDTVTKSMSYMASFILSKPHPSLWSEAEIFVLVAHTVTIELSYDEASKITPPKKFKEVHKKILAGLKKYHDAMPIFRIGIDNMDSNKIKTATNLLNDGSDIYTDAVEEIKSIKQ